MKWPWSNVVWNEGAPTAQESVDPYFQRLHVALEKRVEKLEADVARLLTMVR